MHQFNNVVLAHAVAAVHVILASFLFYHILQKCVIKWSLIFLLFVPKLIDKGGSVVGVIWNVTGIRFFRHSDTV